MILQTHTVEKFMAIWSVLERRRRGLSGSGFRDGNGGKAGDLDAVKAHMAELEAQFDRLKQAMTEELLITTNREHHEVIDC